METWLIYLIASLVVAAFVAWTAILKKWNRRVILGLILVLVVAVPTVTMQQVSAAVERSDQAEISTLVSSFAEMYDGSEYNQLVRADKMEVYLVSRGKLNEAGLIDLTLGTKTSLRLADVWLELEVTTTSDSEED